MANLAAMPAQDLRQWADFVDWQLIRVDASELDYWQQEADRINIEILGRQAMAALKRLPYGLEVRA